MPRYKSVPRKQVCGNYPLIDYKESNTILEEYFQSEIIALTDINYKLSVSLVKNTKKYGNRKSITMGIIRNYDSTLTKLQHKSILIAHLLSENKSQLIFLESLKYCAKRANIYTYDFKYKLDALIQLTKYIESN